MKTHNIRTRHGDLNRITMHHDNLLDGGGGGGGGNNQPYDFRTSLPEDLRKDSVFDPIKAGNDKELIAQLGKGFAHAQRLMGTQRLEAPQENWKPEQWKAFYQKLGAPEKPEGYEVPEFKFAEGIALVPEKIEGWKKTLHELGLTKKQASTLLSKYFEDINGAYVADQEASKQAKVKGEAVLREEFGEKYDAQLDIARAVVKQHGNEEFVKFLGESGLANHPDMIRFLSKIGGMMMEDRASGDGGGLPIGDRTRAQQEIGRLKIDTDFQKALNDRYALGHKEAVDKWIELHRQAAGPSA